MNTIPPEIRDSIIGYLPLHGPHTNQGRAPFSTISRAWKDSIERRTFRSLRIKSTELDEFGSIFKGPNISRRAALKYLTVDFILPSPADGPGCCDVERIPNRVADSESFSSSVERLFTILSRLAKRCSQKFPMTLTFRAAYRWSRYEGPEIGHYLHCPYVPGQVQHSKRARRKARAKFGTFDLLSGVALPGLDDVSEFRFFRYVEFIYLEWAAISRILKYMPRLETLFLDGYDEYKFGRLRRIKERTGLATSVCQLPGTYLRRLDIRFHVRRLYNEGIPVHQLVEVGKSEQDAVSRLIERAADFPSLAVFQIRGGVPVCPDVFQSIISHAGKPFPVLEEFTLKFAAETSDGRWFFVRDDEAWRKADLDTDYEYEFDLCTSEDGLSVFGDGPIRTHLIEPDLFRSLPNKDTFRPFLVDAAVVVSRLSRLRKFVLKLGSSHEGPEQGALDDELFHRVFEVCYVRKGTPRAPKRKESSSTGFPNIVWDAKYLNQNRIYWRLVNWCPWPEVDLAWRGAGGDDVKVVVLDEEKWEWVSGAENTLYNAPF